MFDMRPVGYVIGLLVTALGFTMLAPMGSELVTGGEHWFAFLGSAILTMVFGAAIALSCQNAVGGGLSLKESFLLTSGTWLVLPAFGGLPFILGETDLGVVDAFFESMSGMTTTGTTILSGLDDLGPGILLWRGILQWLGGLGIIIVALIFLPVMRIGGMQFFRSESFDTRGKALPRARDIAVGLLNIYIILTLVCALVYSAAGMSPFDAVVHAMTTMATGGYSTSDGSIGAFSPAAQYTACLFMVLASVPFVALLQFATGQPLELLRDRQVQTYLLWMGTAIALIFVYRMIREGGLAEETLRMSMLHVISFMTGTGYGAADVLTWGPMAFAILFFVGAIGGCTGSTGCSIKIFRYQILMRGVLQAVRRVHMPNRIAPITYDGRRVDEEVLNSVILMFTMFMFTFFGLAIALSLTGLSYMTSITAAWTAIFNIGPAFGDIVTATGSVENLPATAKWLMIGGMFLGRLEIVAVIVLIMPAFWRK